MADTDIILACTFICEILTQVLLRKDYEKTMTKIKHRGVVIHPDEVSDYWNTLLSNTSLNLVGIHPVGGLSGEEHINEAIAILSTPKAKKAIAELINHGVDIEYEMHALSWLLPRSLFAEYPDWFRMNENGERVNDFNCCMTNTAALSFIAKQAAKLAQIFVPTTNRYHFWLDDVASSGCHCPQCSTLSASDLSLLVYNAILNGIKTVNPDACHCYLAYHDTLQAPMQVKPEPSIFLEYAPMERDLHLPLNDVDSIKNISQIKPLDKLLEVFGTQNAKVLDYWLDNSYLSGWKKPVKQFKPEIEVFNKDIAFYRQKGFEVITCFACYLGEDYYDLYQEYPDIVSYSDAFSK